MKELTVRDIQNHIISLPNRPPAMLASQLASIYGVAAKRINEAVRRNQDRFPDDFCFRLTKEERLLLPKPQIEALGYAFGGHLPWLFTRYGANQLSTVLKSPIAAQRSVQIMRAFTMMEESCQQPQQPEPAAAIPADSMVILMKEYITMQKNEIYLLRSLLPKKKRINRPITQADRAEIIELKKSGMSHSAIAKKIRRSTATVSHVCQDSRKEA